MNSSGVFWVSVEFGLFFLFDFGAHALFGAYHYGIDLRVLS